MATKPKAGTAVTTTARKPKAEIILPLAIIRDSAKLAREIGSALSLYDSVGKRLHIAACSALFHAATTGNPAHLQKLYDGLRSNDQQNLRLWLRRCAATVGLNGEAPDGMPSDQVTAAVENGSILAFRNKAFVVTQGHTSDAAKLTAKLLDERWINPDPEAGDRMVFERNNFAEITTLGDRDVLQSIIRATKVDSTENRVVHVGASTKKFLDKIRETAETMLKQHDLVTDKA